jgi:hypothetical protein
VPLARIKELLVADPDQFAVAIAEIDRKLQERVAALQHTRERIAQLSANDSLFVSAEVADYLDRLRELGVSQRMVQMERELWILMQSVWPREAALWIADKRDAIGDPEFCAIYREYDAAFDWSATDPRLVGLAERSKRWFANRPVRPQEHESTAQDRTIFQLIAMSFDWASPAWDRLTEITNQRKADR